MTFLTTGPRQIDLSGPVCMGIINSTPDSFSDGSQFQQRSGKAVTGFVPDIGLVIKHVAAMVDEGVSIVDVGGESTRPAALSISTVEEIDRVIPVIEAIRARFDVCISVDTSTPELMQLAVDAGAEMINDVRALSREGALEVAARSKAAVCLMHMQGQPGTMQSNIHYDNIVDEVFDFLKTRVERCLEAGIELSRICVDPGFGFGKTVDHNYTLLKRLSRFHDLKVPLLIGVSRKSMIGQVIGREVSERLAGSIAATVPALMSGAKIIRSHDVAATIDAIRVHCAYQNAD